MPALVELGAVIFEHGRIGAAALSGLGHVGGTLHAQQEAPAVDLEFRDFRPQQRVGEHAVIVADGFGRKLA